MLQRFEFLKVCMGIQANIESLGRLCVYTLVETSLHQILFLVLILWITTLYESFCIYIGAESRNIFDYNDAGQIRKSSSFPLEK